MIEPATSSQVLEATPDDIRGILDVQNSVLHTNNKELDRGFLWYPLDTEELEEIIAHPESHALMVAKEGKNVIGYFLGYDLDEWQKHKPDWFEALDVPADLKEKIKSQKVFYCRHIATANQRSGIGSVLSQSLQKVAKDRGYNMVLAEVMRKPIENVASIVHHLKQGCREVGSISYSDGTEWGVFIHDLKSE
ncbi:MAG: GNAT family N-acetyltransferase [Candidatus Paceibacterota bacterium]|jgi:predicted GNAT superfamily acetyltransferase